jgi:hypothetical protein
MAVCASLFGEWIRKLDQRTIIIMAIIAATISAAMTIKCMGLLTICLSIPNRVPSGTKSIPHFVHFPGLGWRTSVCIGQK